MFDRDETLIVDVPFNGDPDRVVAEPDVRAALDRLRAAGLPLAVVSNQSGVGRGYITMQQVDAVNRRVDELLKAAADTGAGDVLEIPQLATRTQ